MMRPQTGFAEVNGTRLYFEQAGSGQPLVLLHGFSLDVRMWDDQFVSFARHFRVIRYDMRGFGHSPPPTQLYSHADDLKGLLDYLTIEQAHIMGLSMGGGVAVDFALLYPESVSRLILADSALGGYRWSGTWDASVNPIWTYGRGGDAASAKRLWLSHPLFEPAFLNERCTDRLRQILTDYSGWHWLNQDLGHGLNPPAAECLSAIQAPTLVIVGERDLSDFHVIADVLQKTIRNARNVELDGAGHMSNMEAPERFNRVVLAHLGAAQL